MGRLPSGKAELRIGQVGGSSLSDSGVWFKRVFKDELVEWGLGVGCLRAHGTCKGLKLGQIGDGLPSRRQLGTKLGVHVEDYTAR